jgi:hypothetical protein
METLVEPCVHFEAIALPAVDFVGKAPQLRYSVTNN